MLSIVNGNMAHRRLFLALACLLSHLILTAGPAYRGLLTFKQPDGTVFQAVVRGDEHLHVITDPGGHALIRNGDGFWCYAYYNADGSKVSSGHVVGGDTPAHVLTASTAIPYTALALRSQARRTDAETLFRQNRAALQRILQTRSADAGPVTRHGLVILVDFQDVSMTYTQEDFIDMMTLKGYNRNGAAGSAMDYFDEMFLGDCHFEFTVAPIVTLSRPIAYYFGNDADGQDQRPAQAVAEACRKASEEHGIDFSQFDDDGDGTVDNVIVFVAGRDEAEYPDEETWVWSHTWSLRSAGITCQLDGKRVDTYAVTSEICRNYDNGGTMFRTIGTFCHEFSHTFGIPDYYDTDYEGSGGLANGLFSCIDLMDAGNYNAGGRIPPHYSALEYHVLGLGQCEEIGPGAHTLEPISVGRRYLKYETGTQGEYFLFECRNNASGWDRGIGGKGLLVYHVDQSTHSAGYSDLFRKDLTAEERWSPAVNQVNANPTHECARLVTATPGIDAFTSDGYVNNNQAKVFYPQKNNTAFTPQTDPPFVSWEGTEASVSIIDIAFTGNGGVSFTVVDNHGTAIPEVSGHREEVFQDGAILRWSASDPTFSGKALVEWGVSSGGAVAAVEVAPFAPGQYALVLDGLSARTAYKATIRFGQDGLPGKTATVSFMTKSFPENGIACIALPAAAEDGSFSRGTEIPLHVNNIRDIEHVSWTFNGTAITAGGSGYYTLATGGTLKAHVTRKDGNTDIILKEITVK